MRARNNVALATWKLGDHQETIERLGGQFDPEGVSLGEVNEALHGLG